MSIEEYAELMKQDEKDRQEHPCCGNCRCFYKEYGFDLFRIREEPKANIDNEKCSEWC